MFCSKQEGNCAVGAGGRKLSCVVGRNDSALYGEGGSCVVW